jgi:hypothetical protein
LSLHYCHTVPHRSSGFSASSLSLAQSLQSTSGLPSFANPALHPPPTNMKVLTAGSRGSAFPPQGLHNLQLGASALHSPSKGFRVSQHAALVQHNTPTRPQGILACGLYPARYMYVSLPPSLPLSLPSSLPPSLSRPLSVIIAPLPAPKLFLKTF